MNATITLNKPVDNRIVVIALIFIICVVLLGSTFYTIKITYEINEQISEKARVATDLQSQLARLRSIQQKEEQMELVVRQANTKIPSKPDEAGIIEFVKSITDEITLSGITFSKRENRNFAIEMPFTIQGAGSYNDLLDMLGALTSAERYYTVTSVTLDRNADGELNYIINASAYYNPSAATSG